MPGQDNHVNDSPWSPFPGSRTYPTGQSCHAIPLLSSKMKTRLTRRGRRGGNGSNRVGGQVGSLQRYCTDLLLCAGVGEAVATASSSSRCFCRSSAYALLSADGRLRGWFESLGANCKPRVADPVAQRTFLNAKIDDSTVRFICQ